MVSGGRLPHRDKPSSVHPHPLHSRAQEGKGHALPTPRPANPLSPLLDASLALTSRHVAESTHWVPGSRLGSGRWRGVSHACPEG